MAIKQLALIAARDNRKKKKEKEILKAPTAKATVSKPKTVTVKSNDKGKTYIDRSTISKKPTSQNTTQTRVITNKDRLTSKSTFAGINNDIRTVKTSKNTKSAKKASTGVYDVYERDGKYYYNNGKKEKQVDTKFVQNALKNNRTGVIGNYDSKGKLRETNVNGTVKSAKGIRREKVNNLKKQVSAMGDNIKSGKTNVSQAITDVANIADAATDFGPGKIYKTAAKNRINALDRLWTGSTKTLENVWDTANDLTTGITSSQNYLINRASGMSKKDALKEMEEEQKANAEWVSRDLVNDFKDKTGYNNIQPSLEEGSIVKKDNLVGKTLEGVGGMLPSLAVGQYANLGLASKSLEGLSGLQKAGAVAGNLGRAFVNQAGANTVLGVSSYGSGLEEAYKNGATGKQARMYGLLNAATELATEWITGGIPGTKSEGVLDDIVENLIDKKTAKISNKYVSNVINAIVKGQARGIGEGIEEGLAEIISPYIKNLTYSNGEKVNWNDVKESTLTGYLVGMFLNTPESVSELKQGINDAKIETARKQQLLNEIDQMVAEAKTYEPEQQQQANEIAQRVESGEIDVQEGNALLEQVKDGTYQQNRNLEQIARQERENLVQAAQQGQITPQQYTQELQTLANTVNQTREEINAPQQEVQKQNVTEENNLNQNKQLEEKLNKNGDFSEQVDKYTKKELPSGDTLYLGKTSDILQKIGLSDYPMTMKQSTLKKILTVGKQDSHLHGIDAETIKKLPEALSKPLNILKSSTNDGNVVVITDLADSLERPIIASVEIDHKGQIGNIRFLDNSVSTAYGKNNYEQFMDREIAKGNLLYDIDEGIKKEVPTTRVQFSEGITSSEQNIQQTSENVNTGPEILDKMPTTKSSTIQGLKKGIDTFRKEITDNFAPVYDMSRKMKNPTLYHKVDKILASDGLAQVDLGRNQVDLRGKPFKNFTDENGNKVSMSFEGAFDLYDKIPTKAKNKYLVNQLNMDRLNQGVTQFEGLTYQDSEASVQQLREQYPDIDKWADNVYQYYRNLQQKMVDNGRIPQSLADEWQKTTPHYVHIQRQVQNQGNTGVSVKNGKIDSDNLIRKVKGGDYAILPIKNTTAKFTQNASRAFTYNDFGKEYARTIGYDAEGKNVSQSADIDEIFGFDPEFVNSDGKGNYTMKIYENGMPVEIPISEDVYKSLSPKNITRVGVLAEATNLYKDLLTNKNPFFGFLRNPIKDAGDMFLYSKHPLHKSLATYGKLFAGRTALRNRVITKDGVTAQDIVDFYHNTGNVVNSIYKNGQFESEKGNIRKGVDKALSPIEKGNDFMESMPRITEFWNTIQAEGYTIKDGELVPQKGKNPKKTVDQVLSEASYNAADVTVNFKRGGRTSKAISMNGGIFFNPSVQGASKFTRNITEAIGDAKAGDFQAAKRLVARATMMGVAPAILSAAMYGGDDDYEEMQDYQKDQYYLIRRGDGKWIRIPKGRAISLFESATRRTIDKSKGNKDSFKGYGQLVMNQIAPNNPLDNNIFSPITSAVTNKSWSGNKIVSDSMAKRPVEEQFNEKTDELSKKLGKQLHISPMKINYVLDQYSGVLGDLILPQITPRSSNGTKNPITSILKDNYTFDAANSNKSVGNFYDVKGKLNTKANSVNKSDEDSLKSQYMNTQAKNMYDLYTKKQKIQMDSSLSKKEKYEQALEVQKEINKFAKKATEEVKKTEIGKNTATVGDTLYYKDKKGKWHTESEKTTKNREKLGLSPEEYYYYKNEESYTPPGEEYSQSITSGKYAKQNIAIVDAFNFDPSDYLEYKYKLSKIRGDKDSRGRTIRYSARNKKIKYLNSLPISAVEKAYLMKQNDKYYKGSDYNLKKAISNSSLSNKEKKELYSYLKLGG